MGIRLGAERAIVLGVGLALASAFGCASAPAPSSPYATPAPRSASLEEAPAWLVASCRAHWADPERARRIVCGVGSAPAHRNRVAARETAIARGRAEIARSLEVTIESLVRLVDRGGEDGEVDTIVHQLSSTSMRGVQLEEVWRAESGETYALVSLDVARIEETVRDNPRLRPAERESLAERAAAAFAALDASAAAAR
jgi:hypothetical protein